MLKIGFDYARWEITNNDTFLSKQSIADFKQPGFYSHSVGDFSVVNSMMWTTYYSQTQTGPIWTQHLTCWCVLIESCEGGVRFGCNLFSLIKRYCVLLVTHAVYLGLTEVLLLLGRKRCIWKKYIYIYIILYIIIYNYIYLYCSYIYIYTYPCVYKICPAVPVYLYYTL